MNKSDFMANCHTHNFRCRHAQGDFADYARAALDAGSIAFHEGKIGGAWPRIVER